MPFTPFNIENEYKKHKKLHKESVKALLQWANSQPHLPKITERQIILFYYSCNYSTQVTKDTIDLFFTVRTHCPEYFTKQNPKILNKSAGLTCLYTILPKATPEGDRILYCRLVNSDASKYVFSDQIKLFDMTMSSWLAQNGTDNSLVIVYDLNLSTLSHMSRFNVTGLKTLFCYLQESLPVRLKGLHFINIVPFMDKIMSLITPFMKKELMDILVLHAVASDDLYKYIPKECLPKDLGGSVPLVSELHEQMLQTYLESEDFYKSEESHIVDESKRAGKPKDAGTLFGTEGSFKMLNVD